MSWFSYEAGRQDGIREERNRVTSGCPICALIVVAIIVPLAMAGAFRSAWKAYFHVEPPFIADMAVAAVVLIVLTVIAVDEYQKSKNRARPGSSRTVRVILYVVTVGATLGYIFMSALGNSGHGVKSLPPAAHPAKHERIEKRTPQHPGGAEDSGQG